MEPSHGSRQITLVPRNFSLSSYHINPHYPHRSFVAVFAFLSCVCILFLGKERSAGTEGCRLPICIPSATRRFTLFTFSIYVSSSSDFEIFGRTLAEEICGNDLRVLRYKLLNTCPCHFSFLSFQTAGLENNGHQKRDPDA